MFHRHNFLICPIHKKGDVQNCENSRGISLVTTVYKVLPTVPYRRLKPHANKIIGQYQCGFRGLSTFDQIHTLRQILEKTLEFQIETHHLFIDLKTAYDKVNRNQLYKAMVELGIPPKLVRLTQAMMEGTTAKVKIQNELSESFHILNGLRQADALACILLNITLEKIICEANINQRGNIFYKSVQIPAYADDTDIPAYADDTDIPAYADDTDIPAYADDTDIPAYAVAIYIISRSPKSLQEVTFALDRAARMTGLEINQAKTST